MSEEAQFFGGPWDGQLRPIPEVLPKIVVSSHVDSDNTSDYRLTYTPPGEPWRYRWRRP